MTLVGCDLHARMQQVAVLDTGTGEIQERRLAWSWSWFTSSLSRHALLVVYGVFAGVFRPRSCFCEGN